MIQVPGANRVFVGGGGGGGIPVPIDEFEGRTEGPEKGGWVLPATNGRHWSTVYSEGMVIEGSGLWVGDGQGKVIVPPGGFGARTFRAWTGTQYVIMDADSLEVVPVDQIPIRWPHPGPGESGGWDHFVDATLIEKEPNGVQFQKEISIAGDVGPRFSFITRFRLASFTPTTWINHLTDVWFIGKRPRGSGSHLIDPGGWSVGRLGVDGQNVPGFWTQQFWVRASPDRESEATESAVVGCAVGWGEWGGEGVRWVLTISPLGMGLAFQDRPNLLYLHLEDFTAPVDLLFGVWYTAKVVVDQALGSASLFFWPDGQQEPADPWATLLVEPSESDGPTFCRVGGTVWLMDSTFEMDWDYFRLVNAAGEYLSGAGKRA